MKRGQIENFFIKFFSFDWNSSAYCSCKCFYTYWGHLYIRKPSFYYFVYAVYSLIILIINFQYLRKIKFHIIFLVSTNRLNEILKFYSLKFFYYLKF